MQTAIVAWIAFLISPLNSQPTIPPIWEKIVNGRYESAQSLDIQAIQYHLDRELGDSFDVLFAQSIHLSTARLENQKIPLIGTADFVQFRNLTFVAGHSFGIPVLKIFWTEQHQYQFPTE